MKRIVTATLLGVVAGLICAGGGMVMAGKLTAIGFFWALLNRTLMGFTIGISRLKMHWALHGVLLGAVVGSVFAYNLAMQGGTAGSVIGVSIGSMVFGFLIELFTTVVFKQVRPEPEKTAAAVVH